jgi:hypothetical protein
MSLAIACAAGSFRGAFVHGVLSAFQDSHLRGDVYACASSSAIAAACAALGELDRLGGAEHWQAGLALHRELEGDMSAMVRRGIDEVSPFLRSRLFLRDTPGLVVAASAVASDEAARLTQGDGALRLGRKLLLATRRGDRSWADRHLALHLFGTLETKGVLALTAENLDDVLYATSRMLHAWRVPAWVGGRPYVDASYTCSCPAVEMAELGYEEVIAIVPEPGAAYRDLFQSEPIPDTWAGATIHTVQPAMSLGEVGVEYTTATAEGLGAAFRHGEVQGRQFLRRG